MKFSGKNTRPHVSRIPVLRLCVLLIMVGAGFQCTHPNRVQIVGKNFKDEVSLTQNLVFTFNKDLVPESNLDAWDSTRYILFEPAIKGKFKWTAANELVFFTAFAPSGSH